MGEKSGKISYRPWSDGILQRSSCGGEMGGGGVWMLGADNLSVGKQGRNRLPLKVDLCLFYVLSTHL